MSSRITINIPEDLEKRVRSIQGKRLQETGKSVSFSQIVSELLMEGLK